MLPEAIVFDLDGTLIDTEATWDEVRRGLAEEAGLPWPAGATQAMMGMSTPEWAHYLVETVGLPLTDEQAADATIEAMAAHHERGVELLPGALEVVHRLAAEYPMAVASSSPRVLIDAALRAMNITHLFQATVSTEEVERGKPEPDGYLKAAELLGADPGRCVAIEDSTNGILSALNAGMKVIVIPPHFHPPSQEVLDETTVLETLDELTLDLLTGL